MGSTPPPAVTHFRSAAVQFLSQNDHFLSTCDSSSISYYSSQHHCFEHCNKPQGSVNLRELRLPVQQSHIPGQIWANPGKLQNGGQHRGNLVLCRLKVSMSGQAA